MEARKRLARRHCSNGPWNDIYFGFWIGIYTASVPSTAETCTGGGAVLGKPGGSPARRHSRNVVLMMMMIALITIKSSIVPLIEGLCAQIYFRFICTHSHTQKYKQTRNRTQHILVIAN